MMIAVLSTITTILPMANTLNVWTDKASEVLIWEMWASMTRWHLGYVVQQSHTGSVVIPLMMIVLMAIVRKVQGQPKTLRQASETVLHISNSMHMIQSMEQVVQLCLLCQVVWMIRMQCFQLKIKVRPRTTRYQIWKINTITLMTGLPQSWFHLVTQWPYSIMMALVEIMRPIKDKNTVMAGWSAKIYKELITEFHLSPSQRILIHMH